MKRPVVIAGYVGFGFLALLFGIYLTFPAEAVGQRLAHEVQKIAAGKLVLSFDEMSQYRLSGVEALQDGGQPIEFQVDTLRARLRLLPLLWLSLSVDAEVELGDGVIAARFTPRSEGGFDTELELDELNLASPPVLPGIAGLAL